MWRSGADGVVEWTKTSGLDIVEVVVVEVFIFILLLLLLLLWMMMIPSFVVVDVVASVRIIVSLSFMVHMLPVGQWFKMPVVIVVVVVVVTVSVSTLVFDFHVNLYFSSIANTEEQLLYVLSQLRTQFDCESTLYSILVKSLSLIEKSENPIFSISE